MTGLDQMATLYNQVLTDLLDKQLPTEILRSHGHRQPWFDAPCGGRGETSASSERKKVSPQMISEPLELTLGSFERGDMPTTPSEFWRKNILQSAGG